MEPASVSSLGYSPGQPVQCSAVFMRKSLSALVEENEKMHLDNRVGMCCHDNGFYMYPPAVPSGMIFVTVMLFSRAGICLVCTCTCTVLLPCSSDHQVGPQFCFPPDVMSFVPSTPSPPAISTALLLRCPQGHLEKS